jgi:hypothetical protein
MVQRPAVGTTAEAEARACQGELSGGSGRAFSQFKGYHKLAPVIDRLDAPLMEGFTVLGMSEEELRERCGQGDPYFDVCSSTGDEGVVWIDWMYGEELDG